MLLAVIYIISTKQIIGLGGDFGFKTQFLNKNMRRLLRHNGYIISKNQKPKSKIGNFFLYFAF